MQTAQTFTLCEVIQGRFEARCVAADGTRYLWHRDVGIRVDPNTLATTLINDPAVLPSGPWVATALGEVELREQ